MGHQYNHRALRKELERYGYKPGPITAQTYSTYLKKLYKLEDESSSVPQKDSDDKGSSKDKTRYQKTPSASNNSDDDEDDEEDDEPPIATSSKKKSGHDRDLGPMVDYTRTRTTGTQKDPDRNVGKSSSVPQNDSDDKPGSSKGKTRYQKTPSASNSSDDDEDYEEDDEPPIATSSKKKSGHDRDLGPMVDYTRTRIPRTKKVPDPNLDKSYSFELEKTFTSKGWLSWKNNLALYKKLESKARKELLPSPSQRGRNWTNENSYTYLLLDPRVTPQDSRSDHEFWMSFIKSIFYVGKGTGSRAYDHLRQARRLWDREIKRTDDQKLQRILDIWYRHLGVAILCVFENSSDVHAFTNEASMIDVLGLKNLTNLASGKYYGGVDFWSSEEKHMLGVFLLHEAMQIFRDEGEQQFWPDEQYQQRNLNI